MSAELVYPCSKKVYVSVREARVCHNNAHWRIRVYWCDECRGYHATNAEKRW